MTEDHSPENLRKFLESDDPAMVRMGLSMAKGSGVPEELLPTILRLYMWDDNNTIRTAAKSVFNKHASKDTKNKIKEVWKPPYRFLKEEFRDIYFGRNHFTKEDQNAWAKIRDGFKKIILFCETFQSQKEIARAILDPLIIFLGELEHSHHHDYGPLTHPGLDLAYDSELNYPSYYSSIKFRRMKAREGISSTIEGLVINSNESTCRNCGGWYDYGVTIEMCAECGYDGDGLDREIEELEQKLRLIPKKTKETVGYWKTTKTPQNVLRHQTIISAIRTLKDYGENGNTILSKKKVKVLRENVAYILGRTKK